MMIFRFNAHHDARYPVPLAGFLVTDAVEFHAAHDPVVGSLGEASSDSFHECHLGDGFAFHERCDEFDDFCVFATDGRVVLPGGRLSGGFDMFMLVRVHQAGLPQFGNGQVHLMSGYTSLVLDRGDNPFAGIDGVIVHGENGAGDGSAGPGEGAVAS